MLHLRYGGDERGPQRARLRRATTCAATPTSTSPTRSPGPAPSSSCTRRTAGEGLGRRAGRDHRSPRRRDGRLRLWAHGDHPAARPRSPRSLGFTAVARAVADAPVAVRRAARRRAARRGDGADLRARPRRRGLGARSTRGPSPTTPSRARWTARRPAADGCASRGSTRPASSSPSDADDRRLRRLPLDQGARRRGRRSPAPERSARPRGPRPRPDRRGVRRRRRPRRAGQRPRARR